jgi:hypothetical protein
MYYNYWDKSASIYVKTRHQELRPVKTLKYGLHVRYTLTSYTDTLGRRAVEASQSYRVLTHTVT